MNLVSSVDNDQGESERGISVGFSSPGRNIHSPGHYAWKNTAPALFPDERRPFTATFDSTVNLPRISTGFRLDPSTAHFSGVISASLSSDGNRLLTVSTNQDLRMWDMETGKCLWSLGPVAAAAFGPCGDRIAVGRGDGTLEIREGISGRVLRTPATQTGWLCCQAFSRDGGRVVTSGLDHQDARLWDLETGRCLRVFVGHHGDVICACTDSAGRWLATGSSDMTARVWDMETGRCLQVFAWPRISYHRHGFYQNLITGIFFGPDTETLITSGWDGTLKVWDLAGGLLRTISTQGAPILSACNTLDGRQVVTGDLDGAVKVWDTGSGLCLRTFHGHEGSVMAVCMTPGGERLITAGLDRTVRIRDFRGGETLAVLYHLERGFLWTTSPEPLMPSGWLWTDREDLVLVVERGSDGRNLRTLGHDDPERKSCLKLFNNRRMVLARIHCREGYKSFSARHHIRVREHLGFCERTAGLQLPADAKTGDAHGHHRS